MERKLQKLISDRKLREKMGDRSIEVLKSKFDPKDMAKNFIKLVDEIS
jgi:glycosyltransferase involved in cell wall biosynthesis